MKKSLLSIVILCISFVCIGQSIPTDSLYFGQTPPGKTAIIFAPGLFSNTTTCDNTFSFSPDGKEMVFTKWIGGNTPKLFFSEYDGNQWTTPKEKNFTGALEMEAIFAPFGKKLFFASGTSFPDNIWMIDKGSSAWENLEKINSISTSSDIEFYATLTLDTTMYFQRTWSGVYSSKYKNGEFSEPVKLSNTINSANGVCRHPCISKDGSYLIFEKGDGQNNDDIWISFQKEDKTWTQPLAFGDNINTNGFECQPTLSPDEKYLFFRRDCIPYWVKVDNLIDNLKKLAFAPTLSLQIPNINIEPFSILNYTIPIETFTCEYGTDSLKYTATLNNGSALPSWLDFNSETRLLFGTPNAIGIDTISIIVTNADSSSAQCSFIINVSSTNSVNIVEIYKFQVFPNPASQTIQIKLNGLLPDDSFYQLIDLSGKVAKQSRFKPIAIGSEVIDITELNRGVYILSIKTKNESFSEKLMIE